MWSDILLGFVFLILGFNLGLLAKTWVDKWFRHYSGTMVVQRDELTEKTVYSLILEDYPEKLAFQKMVIFKVNNIDAPEPNRK